MQHRPMSVPSALDRDQDLDASRRRLRLAREQLAAHTSTEHLQRAKAQRDWQPPNGGVAVVEEAGG